MPFEHGHESSKHSAKEQMTHLSQALWSEMAKTENAFKTNGGPMLASAMKGAKDHPAEAALAGTCLILTGVGVLAESPVLIGAAGVGAVCTGVFVAGEWALGEVNKVTKNAGL
ncbi:MAG: hypothetical protein K2X81_02400 [Candidatus Obscuribacterales bacterium]|nr:hypothetical protein [Candidatus Obscuribacterales bacterium]